MTPWLSSEDDGVIHRRMDEWSRSARPIMTGDDKDFSFWNLGRSRFTAA